MKQWLAVAGFLALGVVTLMLRNSGVISDTVSSITFLVLIAVATVTGFVLRRGRPSA